ncbi:MAG: efflux RND transporter permease subunit [Bacteroidota bacterium]
MSITDTSIRRPVATSMAFLIIITLGVIGFRFLPVDLLPPIEFPQLYVSVEYPNVGPQEMETIITRPLENAVAGVPNVKQVRSSAQEGQSWVSIEFAQGTDVDVAANDVRAALDRIRDDFPVEAEAPRIRKFDPNNSPIVIVGANSEVRDIQELTRLLERDITKRFEKIPGVGAINVWGGIQREIKVEIRRDRLKAAQLTSNDVVNAIGSENVNLPGGNVSSGTQRLYVRSLGEFKNIDDIRNVVVSRVDGQSIRVKDVANVVDGYQELERLVTIDGKPMVRFAIRKQTGANTVTVAEDVRKEVKRVNKERDDVELFVTTDQSEFIERSISNVQSSTIWGGLLAVIILYLFLRNGSSTGIIALSIPISIIATFGLLYFSDLTLNQMSFGGLALGVGLIVDNSIVVLENIVRIRRNGKGLKESASLGTREVAGAIVASTLTTSVIFLPVVFMQATSALLFQELAIVVVFSIVCSLLVALTLVPMLASRFLTVLPAQEDTRDPSRFQRWMHQLEQAYVQRLDQVLNNKKWVYGITAVLLGAALWIFPTIPVELTPQTDSDEIDIDLEMAQGTKIMILNEYLRELESIVKAHVPMEDVEHFTTDIDAEDGRTEVELKMVSKEERSMSTAAIADQLREKVVGTIPGADIRVSAQSGLWIFRRLFGSGGSEAIQLEIRGYNLEQADRLAEQIKQRMEQLPEVQGVRLGRRDGRPEQNIIFNRTKIAELGLSLQEVGRIVQTNLGGSRAGVFREGDGEEYPITVRLRPQDRMTTQDLKNISIDLPNGNTVPLSSLVKQELGRGPTEIDRINSQRVTTVTANLNADVALGSAVENIQAATSDIQVPEGFSLVFTGEYQEQQEAQADFQLSILIALILIYMVMAGQFERFVDPLIVMVSVPLALIGVVPILLLTNTSVNIQSLMGLIMLVGIVVNNAIVLIDYINLMRREHDMEIMDAVVNAGRLRLRPILMTTFTTILGLLPLSFGWGTGGEIQAALARTVIGGLTASTFITLLLIPVIYAHVSLAMERLAKKSWFPDWASSSASKRLTTAE